jgi:hypothetical protein
MKNMPSAIKEMPDGAARPVAGKKTQKRSQMASVNGSDFDSPSSVPIPPPAFHRLLQDRLSVQDQAGTFSASVSADGQDQGSESGKTQLPPPEGEKGFLPLASTKSRSGKGRVTSTGVMGKKGKTISMEKSLSGNGSFAVSSPGISNAEYTGERALRSSQETMENLGQMQKASGKTRDHRQVGNVDYATHRVQGVNHPYGQETQEPPDASPLLAAVEGASGKRASGVKTSSPLNMSVAAANGAPLTSGSENGSGVLSPRRLQHASAKMHDRLRSGEHSAFLEGKGGSIRDAAIGEMDGEARTGLPDDEGGVTSSVHGAEARREGRNTGSADDSPLISLLRRDVEKRVQVSREKSLLSAAAVPAEETAPISVGSDDETGILSAGLLKEVSESMRNHIRSVRRPTSEYSAREREEPGKNEAILEMAGSVKAIPADDIDDLVRGVRGAEPAPYKEHKGWPDGSPLLSTFKEPPGEQLRRAVVGEKMSFMSAVSAAPVVDAASISVGSDHSEGVLSPGRQALLMAEVLDTARPLAQQGGGRIRINLSPPSLGALEIDVRVKKEGVELFMVTNNSDVQQTLCSHVDQLRKALAEQGLNMDRFQVVVGDRADGQQWRDPRQEGTSGGHRESWSELGYLPGLDGDNTNDERGNSASSGSSSSVGVINLFI